MNEDDVLLGFLDKSFFKVVTMSGADCIFLSFWSTGYHKNISDIFEY